MKLYRVDEGVVVEDGSGAYLIEDDWDELLNRGNLFKYLKSLLDKSDLPAVGPELAEKILPPRVVTAHAGVPDDDV